MKRILSFLIGLGAIALAVFLRRSKLTQWIVTPLMVVLFVVGGFFIFRSTSEEPFTFAAGTEDVIPNATASEAGGSCTTANAHTNMDDDVNGGGDSNVCNADSNTANHDIRFNFGVPVDSDPISQTTDAQVFAILAVNSQPSANGNATVALDLYCNGVLVEAGADQQLSDSYAIVTEAWTFNTGSCASDGSDVEVLVDCVPRDVGGTGNDSSCNYEAVEWRATTAAASTYSPTDDIFML